MKRILLYTDTPIYGGAERQMELLARHLAPEEFEISLACGNNKELSPLCQKFIDAGRPVYRFLVSGKHDPRIFTHLYRLLKREKFDLIHLNLWNPASCRYAFLAARLAGTPIIVTEHDPFPLSKLKHWIKDRLIGWAEKIITISHSNKELLGEMHGHVRDKLHVVHNGIDVDWWKSQHLALTESDREEIREQDLGAALGDTVFLSIGELHERKGHDFLIDVFKAVHEKFPKTKLIIVGEGKNEEKYRRLAMQHGLRDAISLLGHRQDIPRLLFAADIFVHPSRREAFGFAVLEAMVSGLPVIASRVGGIPELIEQNESGVLVSSEDNKDWEEAMTSLLQDMSKRKHLSLRAREHVDQYFTAQRMADETAAVYGEIFSRQHRPIA